MRGVTLKERQAKVVRLPVEESEHLLREHGHHLQLVPLGRRRWKITPTHLVGTFEGPLTRYVIRPKLPLHRLLMMLDPEASMPA